MSKNILIAGASGDIGFFLAQNFVKSGHAVYGFGRRKNTLQSADFKYTSLDISDQDSVKIFFSDIKKEKFKIDVFINCIGIEESMPIGFLNKEKINSSLSQNLIPLILFSKEIASLMVLQNNGLLINLSSIIARLANSGSTLYGITKVSTEYFYRVLDTEYFKMGIRACSVRLPIVLETQMAKNLKSTSKDYILQETENFKAEVSLSDVFIFIEDILNGKRVIPRNQIFEW